MKRRLLILITSTMLVLGITACGGSSTNTGNAGNVISDAMSEEIGDATPAPTEAPAEPTPEPTATPEPTLAPIEVTTEDGTMLPTEAIVYIKGSAVKLPCTVSEFMERTGEKIFENKIYGNYENKNNRGYNFNNYTLELKVVNEDDDYKDYIIYSIHTRLSKCDGQACTDVTLHGDIYVGAECSSWDDLAAIYGTCDAPDANGNWWNIGDDVPEKEVDVFDCTWEEFQTLFMGYCVGFDDYEKIVTNVEVTVSSDKLFELYGIR